MSMQRKNIYVIFQLDTEDFVTPETDDVLLDLAWIFEKHGVKGSFAIVGEKARALKRRGRADIIEALKRQDVAYQSNLHSVHPTIAEYLKDLDWQEGVEEFIKREGEGARDLEKIFGAKPSAFIQPGGSWAPQAPYATRKMGIKVYADGLFPSQLVWFCNTLVIGYSIYYQESESGTRQHLEEMKRRFAEAVERTGGKGVIVIILHPCMLLTKEFWDAVNFARGKNPEKLTPPPIVSKETYAKRIAEFDEFVGYVTSHPDVKVVTYRELPELVEPTPAVISPENALKLAEQAQEKLSYYAVAGHYYTAAETFSILLDFFTILLKGEKPEQIRVRSLLGPTRRVHAQPFNVEIGAFAETCRRLHASLDSIEHVPSEIQVGSQVTGPDAFLKALARTLLQATRGELPNQVTLDAAGETTHVDFDVAERVKNQWGWIIFPENFTSKKIIEHTLLQLWTWKPTKIK